jgi:hypothetical protein
VQGAGWVSPKKSDNKEFSTDSHHPLCGEILPEILDWLVVPSIFDLR